MPSEESQSTPIDRAIAEVDEALVGSSPTCPRDAVALQRGHVAGSGAVATPAPILPRSQRKDKRPVCVWKKNAHNNKRPPRVPDYSKTRARREEQASVPGNHQCQLDRLAIHRQSDAYPLYELPLLGYMLFGGTPTATSSDASIGSGSGSKRQQPSAPGQPAAPPAAGQPAAVGSQRR